MLPTFVSLSSFFAWKSNFDWKSKLAIVAAWYCFLASRNTVVPSCSSLPHIPKPVLFEAPSS